MPQFPLQHWSSSEHCFPNVRQPHWSLMQSPEQQSAGLKQVTPLVPQPHCELPLHMPPQQSASMMQVSPSWVQPQVCWNVLHWPEQQSVLSKHDPSPSWRQPHCWLPLQTCEQHCAAN